MPSQEQVMAQLRIIIPALGTMATAFGITQAQAGSYEQIALASIGPISYIIVAVWSMFANTRASIIAKAAKPPAPGIPAAQIVLSPQEADIAQKLPNNVNTTDTVKVTPK